MRFQAILAAMLVLLSGTLRFCPACEAAQQERSSSVSAHACCEKQEGKAEAPMTAPQQNPASEPDGTPASRECPRDHVTHILQTGSLDAPHAFDVVALVVPAALAFETRMEQPLALVSPDIGDPSPPPLVSIPIRI